jgi:hypothetical protein
MEDTTQFKPGMLVAYGEVGRGGVMRRVIVIYTVKSVGKKLVKLDGAGTGNFRLSGQSTSETYRDRWIMPLTKQLYAQAEADKASHLGLALGHVLPEPERVACCREPKLRGGRCDNCGTWLEDLRGAP